MVSLPQYVVLEEDYLGKVRLMEILNMLYDIPVDKEDFERALEQRRLINERLETSPEVKGLLSQLESAYDARVAALETEGTPRLTSEMEDIFWTIMGKDVGKGLGLGASLNVSGFVASNSYAALGLMHASKTRPGRPRLAAMSNHIPYRCEVR